MRKHWIDNLRWVTVLLVLLYHVIYFYNNKGVFGGIGGFGDGPQYQDTLMYILYPWFMPLLFLLAGISARYSLCCRGVLPCTPSPKEWFRSRTRKLLVPATIGLLVFHWMTGYFNTHVAGVDVLADLPQPAKYFAWAFSGIGPLWFIQDLWLFSLILLIIRRGVLLCTPETRMNRKGVHGGTPLQVVALVLLGVLFWLGEQTLNFHPRVGTMDGLWNLYKPLFYLIPFLLGYFVFWRDKVHEMLGKAWIPLMAAAVASGALLIVTTFGENNTTPQYLASPLNNLYGWLMCLAMMGWFKAKFDRTGRFAAYMTRSSFGLYIVHYLVVASLGYMMKVYTQLPPVAMYLILTVAVFTLSPLLYELLRRIPVVRWCVLGERKQTRNVK
jgi:surface polysaccharide O-acyltransferase-like enzyme